MIEQINDIIWKISTDIWLYAGLGIVAAVFIFGLILSLATGQSLKFKKAVKKFLKNPDAKNATVTAADMPVKIKKLYKRVKATGEKPSDVISFDACVSWTYSASYAAKFVKTVLFSSLLTALLTGGAVLAQGGNTGVAVFAVAAAGLLFTLLAGLTAMLIYKGLVAAYNNYVDGLDKLSKGGNFEGELPGEKEAKSNEPEIPVYTAPVQNETENAAEIHEERFRTFEAPTRLNIELDDEHHETVIEAEPAAAAPNSVLSELDEEIKKEKEEREKAAEEEARQREARAAALERAKAQAEERRRAAQQRSEAVQSQVVFSRPAEQVVYSRPAEVPVNQTINQPPPPPPADTGSADVVIARIEQINREGASLATMKEVALLLQQERNKPENKTPEQQKKLNEALSSLLKSMSAASKR